MDHHPEIVAFGCPGLLPLVVGANVGPLHDWYRVLWAEDIVKMLFIWIVFLGGAVAVKYEAHVRMGMFTDRLPPVASRSGCRGAAWCASPRSSSVPSCFSSSACRIVQISMFREMPSLEISVGYFMTIIPFSGALMIFYVVLGSFFVPVPRLSM